MNVLTVIFLLIADRAKSLCQRLIKDCYNLYLLLQPSIFPVKIAPAFASNPGFSSMTLPP